MRKRTLFATGILVLCVVVAFDLWLTEHNRAKFLAYYVKTAPRSVPEEAVQTLYDGLSVCEVRNRGQYTQHQLCWVTVGAPPQAMLQLFGPAPLVFELLTGQSIGDRIPNRPVGRPITGIISLPKNS